VKETKLEKNYKFPEPTTRSVLKIIWPDISWWSER